jgi:hypothetical protein
MANVNQPHGFTYISIGAPYPPRIRTFNKVVGFGTAIFQQDVCALMAGAAGGGSAAPLEPLTTPGTTIAAGVSLNFGAASTATRHHVITSQAAEFEAQDDNSTDGLILTNMGLNANATLTAGNATTGFSKHQIAEAGIAVTSSMDMHLLRLFPDPNNAFGPNARIVIKFNGNREATATVGV